MDAIEIRPGSGVGKIALGASSSTVRAFLAKPDEIDGDEWTYEALDMTVTFERDHVVAIESFAESLAVDGTIIGDKDRTAIADILDDKGWGQPKIAVDRDATEHWTYGNGVVLSFAGDTLENAVVEVAGRHKDIAPPVPKAKNYTRRRLAFWATFCAAFSAFAFYAGMQANQRRAEIKTWPVTKATVARIQNDENHLYVHLAFRVLGEPREEIDRISNTTAYHVGDVVDVRYKPQVHAAYIDSEIADGSGDFTVGVLMAILALGLFVWFGAAVVRLRRPS